MPIKKGRHTSPDTEFKQGHKAWNKGIPRTEETKEKISKAKLGKHLSEEVRQRTRDFRIKNLNGGMTGKHHSEESKKKMSEAKKGKNHNNWKGGISVIIEGERKKLEYIKWRNSVKKRDNYTCQICHEKSRKGIKVILHSHHIKSFADYPEERFNIDNGITLCYDCHMRIHHVDALNQQ